MTLRQLEGVELIYSDHHVYFVRQIDTPDNYFKLVPHYLRHIYFKKNTREAERLQHVVSAQGSWVVFQR